MGEVVDLFGGDVRLVQFDRHLALLSVPPGSVPARPVERLELGDVVRSSAMNRFHAVSSGEMKMIVASIGADTLAILEPFRRSPGYLDAVERWHVPARLPRVQFLGPCS